MSISTSPSGSPASHAYAVRSRTALMITAALDAYGSDLQLFQSGIGLHDDGWRVVVIASRQGRLADRLAAAGVQVEFLDFPVITRAQASPRGFAQLLSTGFGALPRMVRMIKRHRPDVLCVNTVTMPWWLLAGRLAGVPTVCHVHEAEVRDRRLLRLAMTAPLMLARLVIVNSRSTESATTELLPVLRRRSRLIYNGIEPPKPGIVPYQAPIGGRRTAARLVVVGRISPRKATHVAVEATAILREQGRHVRLEIGGTVADGKEAYLEQLHRRAARLDLRGAVTFLGYTAPVWPVLQRADVVLAPSLGESFGNAVVEAQLAGRPVVATAVQGHLETVTDGVNGLLVPCEDSSALAAAVARLLDNPEFAEQVARNGQQSALQRFSSVRYRAEINEAFSGLCRIVTDERSR